LEKLKGIWCAAKVTIRLIQLNAASPDYYATLGLDRLCTTAQIQLLAHNKHGYSPPSETVQVNAL
jgi:hypothetical protein